MVKISNLITPIVIILVVLFLTPLIIQLGGSAAETAQQTFNTTIKINDTTSVNLGGVAALIIMLAMIFLPIYIIERYIG